jgi:hypothetical protein
MKVGDLICFKLVELDKQGWSNPAIVLREYVTAPFNYGMWVLWCDGSEYVIDDENYEIVYLTSS